MTASAAKFIDSVCKMKFSGRLVQTTDNCSIYFLDVLTHRQTEVTRAQHDSLLLLFTILSPGNKHSHEQRLSAEDRDDRVGAVPHVYGLGRRPPVEGVTALLGTRRAEPSGEGFKLEVSETFCCTIIHFITEELCLLLLLLF